MAGRANRKRMETHVRVLAWVLVVAKLLGLGIGALVFLFLTSVGVATGDPDATVILPIVGMFVLGIVLLFTLPGIIAGFGLQRRWAWARYLALVVGFLDLFSVPFGTLIGIYTFWVLLQKDAASYFERDGGLDADAFYDAYDDANDEAFGDAYDDDDYETYGDHGAYDDESLDAPVEQVYYRGEDESTG